MENSVTENMSDTPTTWYSTPVRLLRNGNTSVVVGVVVIAVVVALALIGYSVLSYQAKPALENTYSADSFTIGFAKGWEAVKNPEDNTSVGMFSPQDADGKSQQTVTVVTSHITAGIDVQDLANDRMDLAEDGNPNITVTDTIETTLGGEPAAKVIYEQKSDSDDAIDHKLVVVYMIKVDKLFEVTYDASATTYNQALSTFEQMLSSFKVI